MLADGGPERVGAVGHVDPRVLEGGDAADRHDGDLGDIVAVSGPGPDCNRSRRGGLVALCPPSARSVFDWPPTASITRSTPRATVEKATFSPSARSVDAASSLTLPRNALGVATRNAGPSTSRKSCVESVSSPDSCAPDTSNSLIASPRGVETLSGSMSPGEVDRAQRRPVRRRSGEQPLREFARQAAEHRQLAFEQRVAFGVDRADRLALVRERRGRNLLHRGDERRRRRRLVVGDRFDGRGIADGGHDDLLPQRNRPAWARFRKPAREGR